MYKATLEPKYIKISAGKVRFLFFAIMEKLHLPSNVAAG